MSKYPYIFEDTMISTYTVELLDKDTFGTNCFVLCREVVLFQR